MSLQLPFGVAPVNPVPVDAHSGPYTGVDLSAAVASANSSIASGVRFQSMEVRIVVSGVSYKYWYNSGTTNADLTPFSINDNTSYINTVSGNLQTQITSNDSDITALQTSTGNLDTRVTQNASNVTIVSGIAQGAASDVVTASGHLQTQITSNDSDITALQTATGNLDTRVTQNANDIDTVSGLIVTNSADSGIELVGSTFIMGGTGSLDKLNITSIDSNQVPLTVKGAAAQAEKLQEWQDSSANVVAYIDKDGNALFSGLTALGDLDVSGTLTFIHSTNVTIADKQLELASDSGSAISGDAYIDQGGIVLKSTNGDKEWIWRDSTDAWTASDNIDVGSNSVIFDGISQTIAYTGQETNVSGYVNTVSGNLQSQITSNDSDITTLQTATGVLRTDINNNDTDIAALQTATGNLDTRVTQNASNISSASGHLQTQITSNDSDITTLQTATGVLRTDIDSNDTDITALQTATGVLRTDIDSNDTDITALQTATGVLRTDIDSNDTDITALQTATGVLRTDIDSNDTDITALQTATGNLDTRVTQNASNISSASGHLQTQITSNDSDITTLQTATGVLRTDIDSNDTDITALQTATGVLRTDIDSNDTDITALQTATGVLRTDIDSNDTDITALQTATGVLRTDIDSNDTDITALQTATGVLRTDIDSNDTDITALQTATGNLDTRVTQNASNISSASGHLQTQITSNDSDITTLQTATGVLRTDIDSNDTDITALQTATGVLRTDIDSNDTDITALQTATGVLRTDIDSNDTDITALQTATGVLRTDIDSNDTDITALQTATGNLDTRVTLNTSNVTTVSGIAQDAADDVATASGHLQTQITANDSEINTVSGLLYNNWNVNVKGNSDSITSNQTVTFTGVGLSDVSYNSSTNTVTISGQGGGGTMDSWNLAVNGDATSIGDGETVDFTGQGDISISRDGNTVKVSGASQDLSSYATTSYVNTVSGNLQSQITLNDTDINIISGVAQGAADDVTIVSGIAQGAASDVATASGHLQTQITSNDSDITTLQTATGVLRTDINSNDTDITTLQTATGNLDTRVTQNASNVTIVSGIAQGAADDVVTVSGLIPNFTAGSGLVLDGEEFNVYGGTGNFDEIEFLTTPNIVSLQDPATATTSSFIAGYAVTGSTNSVVIGSHISTHVGTAVVAVGNNLLENCSPNLQSSVVLGNEAVSYLSSLGIIALGHRAGRSLDQDYNTNADRAIFIGYNCGNNISGDGSHDFDNTIGIGAYALSDATNVIDSIAIGFYAGHDCVGEDNNFIGYFAGADQQGDYNSAIGLSAGRGVIGSYNLSLGFNANKNTSGSNNIEIVTQGAFSSIIGNNSNKLNIENTIIGDTSNKFIAIGNVGTGNLTPDATLEILPAASTNIGLIVQGAASQNANLQEWQNTAGTTLAYVDSDGNAMFSGIIALGDLEVSGDLTYISSTNVTIVDKQLELASNSGSAVGDDSHVDQGGIVLKSTNGDKEWIWRSATDSWTTNKNINVGSNAVIFDGISQTIAYTGQLQDLTGYATTGSLNIVSGIAQGAANDIATASGHLQTQITSNDSDITALQTATGVLRTDINSNDTDITALQTATGVLRTDINSNDTDITALQTATGVLRTDINSNDTDITALQTATGVLRTDINSNDTDITALQTATGVLRTDINSNDTDITALQTATGVLRTDINSNDTDITALQTATGVLRTDINSNDTDITALQTATGNLDTRVTQNANDIDTVSGVAYKTFVVTNNGSSDYTFDGMGLNSENDPTIYLHKGHTYYFDKQIASHPFRISATDGGSVYQDADGNNIEIGGQGILKFEVPQNAPDKLYYFCTSHPSSMKGEIYTTIDIDNITSASGHLQGQITSNDTDITALQTATGVLRTDINSNDTDIAALQTATGNLDTRVTQNASNISAASGHLQTQITSNDSDITALQTATGVLRTDINSNDTDITALQTATGVLRTDINSNDTDITALQTATGVLRTDINSNDTDITALQTATGNLDTRVTQNANDIDTVSGVAYKTFAITNNGSSDYVFDGMGLNSATDPDIYLHKGHTYYFDKQIASHPFRISATDGGSVYQDADGNNIEIGGQGVLKFEVPQDAPDKLYYFCTSHPSSMKGEIYTTISIDDITNASGHLQTQITSNDTDVTALQTATGVLRTDINSNDTDIAALQTATGVLRTDINSNDTDIAALQTATGNLDTRVTQNASNISSASGHLQTQITSNDSDITTLQTATGVLRTDINSNDTDIAALQTATGNLDTRVTQNASNISSASGHLQTQITSNDSDITTLQTATGVLRTDINNNDTDISTVSGLLYNHWVASDGSTSGTISALNTLTFSESGTTSIAFDSGTNTLTIGSTGAGGGIGTNWNLSVEGDSTNIGDGETVDFTGQGGVTLTRSSNSVIISGAGTTYTAGSGLVLDGNEFNVHGGSGNFQYVELKSSSQDPQLYFLGSGSNDTPITLNVLSSFQSASNSGSALVFDGTEGQLFAITDNLSSGVIFSVSDIAGLPLIEADASGDVKLIEFGRYVGVGTGTPEYQLDVFGTGRFSEGIIFPDGNRQTIAYTGGGGGGGSSPTGTASGIAFFGGDNNLTSDPNFFFDSGSDILHLPGMTIDSNGTITGTNGQYLIKSPSRNLGFRISDGNIFYTALNQDRCFFNQDAFAVHDVLNFNSALAVTEAKLFYDTTNVVAQRYGTSPQEFRIYHSGNSSAGDPTNYERLSIKATGYNYEISPQVNGGTAGSVIITNDTSSKEILVVKGAASQSANLQEWQDSAGNTYSRVTNSGYFSNPTDVGSEAFGDCDQAAIGTNSIFILDSGTTNGGSQDRGVFIGSEMTINGASNTNILIGHNANISAGSSSSIGIGANVSIGGNDDNCVVIGVGSSSNSSAATVIGDASQASTDAVAIGRSVNAGAGEIIIKGNQATGIYVDSVGNLTIRATGIFQSGIQFGDGTVQTTAAGGGGGGTPGGSNTNIQFNNGGAFSGESNFTWDYNTDALTVSGSTLISNTGTVFEVTNTGGTTLFAVEDSDEVQVIVAKQVGQTGNPFEVRDEFDVSVASIDVSGNISGNNIIFGDGTIQTTAAGGGGGGSTTGTASGVAFFGGDNNLTESTSFTFDSGNKILNVFGTGTEYGTLKLGENARWVSRNGTAISYQSSAANFPVLFNAHHSVVLASNVNFGWSSNSSDPFGATTDTIVSRDSAGTVGFYKSGGSTYGTINVGNMVIDNPTSSNVNLVVKGAASQSANLQEWQNSAGTVLADVDNSGNISGNSVISQSHVGVTLSNLYASRFFGDGRSWGLQWTENNGSTYNDVIGFNGAAVPKTLKLNPDDRSDLDVLIYTAQNDPALQFDADQDQAIFKVPVNIVGDVDVTGALTATTKSFLIDHPTKEGMKLQYGSLEGPENGVYVRGTTDLSTIELPDYWVGLVDENSITVSLTPIGSFQQLYVEDKNSKQITVGGVWGSYDYVVYAERKDVDKLEVEW